MIAVFSPKRGGGGNEEEGLLLLLLLPFLLFCPSDDSLANLLWKQHTAAAAASSSSSCFCQLNPSLCVAILFRDELFSERKLLWRRYVPDTTGTMLIRGAQV
jgi:hypothetical protein